MVRQFDRAEPSQADQAMLDLVSRAKAKDPAARQELVLQNAGLVGRLAQRLGARGRDRDDLFQAGCLGLLLAADRFDPGRGTRFSTYAVPYILGEMRKCLAGARTRAWRARRVAERVSRAQADLARKLGRQPFVAEIAAETGLERTEVVAALDWNVAAGGDEAERHAAGAARVAEEQEQEVVDRVVLAEALSGLEERERRILFLRYFRRMTQARVGHALGLSQSQVSRLERRALLQLRTVLTGEMDRG